MSARDVLREAVAVDFVPFIRSVGFTGTFPTWRLRRDGDVGVVELWGDKYNEGPYGQFFLSVAVVPPAWWAWTHECAADHPRGSTSREGREREWDGLYRALLTPSRVRGAEAWEVDSVAGAKVAAAGMTEAMRISGLPSLLALMGPGRMLAALRTGGIDDSTPVRDQPGMRELVEAVLLTDIGGLALEGACRRLDNLAKQPYGDIYAATAAWARGCQARAR